MGACIYTHVHVIVLSLLHPACIMATPFTFAESGFIGYKEVNFVNNSGPDFIDGENFFTIFGLFFATVTGILAGINMSGDLRDPFHNIPHGTLAALGAGYASVFDLNCSILSRYRFY